MLVALYKWSATLDVVAESQGAAMKPGAIAAGLLFFLYRPSTRTGAAPAEAMVTPTILRWGLSHTAQM